MQISYKHHYSKMVVTDNVIAESDSYYEVDRCAIHSTRPLKVHKSEVIAKIQ